MSPKIFILIGHTSALIEVSLLMGMVTANESNSRWNTSSAIAISCKVSIHAQFVGLGSSWTFMIHIGTKHAQSDPLRVGGQGANRTFDSKMTLIKINHEIEHFSWTVRSIRSLFVYFWWLAIKRSETSQTDLSKAVANLNLWLRKHLILNLA